MSGELSLAVGEFNRWLDGKYARQRYSTAARVTSVSKDTSGRAIAVVCTIDGVASQTVAVPWGSPIGVNSIIGVINAGTETAPVWQYGTLMPGAPAGAVMLVTGPDGQPYITPAGTVSAKANLLRNGDFTLTHKDHLNQPAGWVLSGHAQLVDGIEGG